MASPWLEDALTEEVSEPFVQRHVSHLRRGRLRMAIIFGIFFYLLRALVCPAPLRAGAPAADMVLHRPNGWPASAIRATVMLSVVIIGWVLQRPSDLINSFSRLRLSFSLGATTLFQAASNSPSLSSCASS